MAGKILHEDLACFFEIRTVHPQPQEPCAECIFLILIVDILCLDAFLADGLLVHQDGKVAESRQVSIVGSRRESCEGNLFFCDHQTFHRSSALCFVTFKRLDEVCHRVGATVIPQCFDQVGFHMEVPARCLADESAPAVDEVDQIAKAHTIMLAGWEGKFQIQWYFFWLVFCFRLLFAFRFLCIRLILCCTILCRIIRLLFGHRLRCQILGRLCAFRLVIRALNALAAADQSLIQQGRQQLGICILRLDQKIAVPVDGVVADVISIQRCSGVVRMDTRQLLHAICKCLTVCYVQFKFQHNSLPLSFSSVFVHPDVLFGSTYITLNRSNIKAISRYSSCSTNYTRDCRICCVNRTNM